MPHVAPVYAGLLTLLYLVLTWRVVQVRGSARVSLGTGDNPELERRIRVHGNFAEYAPLFLILLLMAELRGTQAIWLHVLGVAFLAGRISHVAGVSPANGIMPLRATGMALTLVPLTAAALLLVLGL